ncbi:DUF421 domain-containing protein [Mucilaginibacter koreensis]
MEDILIKIFGEGKDLSVSQMCCRAFVVYFIALVLIRIAGRRTFGKKSAFDNSIALILGAVLSRAVVGASAFVPTVSCCFVLVGLHRLLAWLSTKSDIVRQYIKGENLLLFQNDEILHDNLRQAIMSEKDLMSDVRTKGSIDNLAAVKEIHMEPSGEVSVIKKDA